MHNTYLRVLNNYYSTLQLECLSNNESLLLLHNLMNEIDLPKKIKNQIIEKTEGNPFFMEEVVLSFIERGIINTDDGKLDTNIIENEFQIPNLLHSVIVSRVDCLPAIDKLTLQTASVIGKKIPNIKMSKRFSFIKFAGFPRDTSNLKGKFNDFNT